MHDGVLYMIGFSILLLRCVAKDEARKILMEIHKGSYGDHTGRQTLVKKILYYEFFWPTLTRDVADYTKR